MALFELVGAALAATAMTVGFLTWRHAVKMQELGSVSIHGILDSRGDRA